MTYKILILIFLVNNYCVYAQEFLLPLQTNSVIEKYIKQNNSKLKSINASNDTLKIPFFDDFSKDAIYPDASNWIDEQVFINKSFGDNPPSIGVATFDALDFAGELHSNAGTSLFLSDTLTSKPINLANRTDKNPISISTALLFYYNSSSGSYYPSDSLFYLSGGYKNCKTNPTTYNIDMIIYYDSLGWVSNVSDYLYTYDSISGTYLHIDKYLFLTFSPADSLYLSFYYQPQGLGGREPDVEDSLVLEFRTPNSSWKNIWAKPGEANKPFKQVLIPIVDSSYFKIGFQFRFKNYCKLYVYPMASFASNIGFWNIDYVKLDKNRNISDTIHQDVTFVNDIDTVLKDFKSVPWDHYKSVSNFQQPKLKFIYRNLYSDTINVLRKYKIFNKTDNTLVLNNTLGSENIYAFNDDTILVRTDTSNFFPFTSSNKAEFDLKLITSSTSNDISDPYIWNDTLVHHQIFDNYYAYDDGTPEIGYGLSGQSTQNSKLAFKFYTLKPDTLRGVNMFFNRTLNDESQNYFYLTIWNNISGKPGQIIYSKMGERPEYHGLNEFHYYNLDTAIFISDTFYIGWIQTTQDLLNIGFDLNNNNSAKVFYNIDGNWTNISYAGTPMMRPVFSNLPINHVSNNFINKQLYFYPNPASDFITVENYNNCIFQVIDITGRILLETKAINNKIDISKIPNGIYFIRTLDKYIQNSSKLIINRL